MARAAAGAFGGDGDKVTIENQGVIRTDSHASTGIEAQSIGGTGGSGGSAGGVKAIGGGSGSGGSGGNIIIANSGEIMTGLNPGNLPALDAACPYGCAYGILGQSIGGGGGNGGGTKGWFGVGSVGGGGGVGGDVTVTNSEGGTISTAMNDSTALLAQSIGGAAAMAGPRSRAAWRCRSPLAAMVARAAVAVS